MQRILDIDLDFFIEGCCELAEKGKRPSAQGHDPWSESAVRQFLEQNVGISRDKPVRGRIFETHDKALLYWRELIEKGSLKPAFSVTHIDAHSDLGIGKPGPGFVLNTVISTCLEQRRCIERYYKMNELDEANYLLFALGFRWIGELVNVRNPSSHEDIPREILVCNDKGERCALHLESFASRLLEGKNGREPHIPYTEYKNYADYKANGDYSYMSLAISPRYLPKEAEHLADVIAQYMIIE